jgi:hypothetical protein
MYSPPQVILLAIDLHEDFIDEEGITIALMFSLQPPSIYCSELDTPEPDSLSTDGASLFGDTRHSPTGWGLRVASGVINVRRRRAPL